MCFAQRMPSDVMKAPLPPGWQAVARCFQLSKSFCVCESMWVALVQQRVVDKELRR